MLVTVDTTVLTADSTAFTADATAALGTITRSGARDVTTSLAAADVTIPLGVKKP